MARKPRLSIWLLACAGAIGVTSCSTQPGHADATKPLFVDASPWLGKTIQVRGLLHWTFENQNLFPPETTADHMSSKTCLPVLISSDQISLIELARKNDGRVVTVSGRIVDAAPPGMVSVTTCKQTGIEVSAID